MRQAYERPTPWLGTINTRTTFSLTTCQNRVQFHSGGLGIAPNKMAESLTSLISAALIVSIIWKRRKREKKMKEVLEEWLRRRTERGVYRQLLEELRLEDEENYRRWMDTKTFQVRLMVLLFRKSCLRFCTRRWLANNNFVRHFDARKLHLPRLLSRNLSQNTSFSIDFGYDCRRVLKHVLKSCDTFCEVHDSPKRVVGLI